MEIASGATLKSKALSCFMVTIIFSIKRAIWKVPYIIWSPFNPVEFRHRVPFFQTTFHGAGRSGQDLLCDRWGQACRRDCTCHGEDEAEGDMGSRKPLGLIHCLQRNLHLQHFTTLSYGFLWCVPSGEDVGNFMTIPTEKLARRFASKTGTGIQSIQHMENCEPFTIKTKAPYIFPVAIGFRQRKWGSEAAKHEEWSNLLFGIVESPLLAALDLRMVQFPCVTLGLGRTMRCCTWWILWMRFAVRVSWTTRPPESSHDFFGGCWGYISKTCRLSPLNGIWLTRAILGVPFQTNPPHISRPTPRKRRLQVLDLRHENLKVKGSHHRVDGRNPAPLDR